MTNPGAAQPADEPAKGEQPRRRLAQGARAFVSKRPAPQKIGLLAAIALLLTAPFGGLAEAEKERTVETLAYGQQIDIGPFVLEIKNVLTLPDLAPQVVPEPGNQLLVVNALVTNETDRAERAFLAADTFSARGVPAVPWPGEEFPRPRIVDVNDATTLGASEVINPGQTYDYAFILQVGSDWVPGEPDPVVVSLTGYTFQADDPQTLDPDVWLLDDEPLATGPVEVEVDVLP